MAILFVGIDLAKNILAVHGVANCSTSSPRCHYCTIAMEPCSGARHWERLFATHDHSMRLIASKFVAPYRMSGVRDKNDAADAAAIGEPAGHSACR